MRVKIASRQSDLARIQAYSVGEALKPRCEITYRFRESLGDQNQNDPLWKMPERGVFTQDFYGELVRGETDLVVHSWKDLPVEDREETVIIGTLPRADLRDVLLLKKSACARVQSKGALRVFSSSPRRAYNLESFFKGHLPWPVNRVEFCSVRGNIQTRVQKLLADPEIDALIVAKAALDRLLVAGSLSDAWELPPEERQSFFKSAALLREMLSECQFMVLPLSLNPTAAAQGALAIEIKKDRQDLIDLLKPICCEKTAREVQVERTTLKGHGGGCHQKIGVSVLERPFGQIFSLRGLTDHGVVLNEFSRKGTPHSKAVGHQIAPWPNPTEKATSFFAREALPLPEFSSLSDRAFFVARAEALPAAWHPKVDQIVWTAGMETWRKLASRGIWVHGSAEGLGEDENPRIDALLGGAPRWLKLSHQESTDSPLETLATYVLKPLAIDGANWAGRNAFFWTSGSLFKRALEVVPELRNASHFCGPGNTYQSIKKILGDGANLTIALNYEAWWAEMKGSSQ